MQKTIIVILLLVGAGVLIVLNYQKITNLYLHYHYPLKYKEQILDCSSLYSLNPSLVSAIIYEESRFKDDSVSEKGAVGLMQILPETAYYIAERMNDKQFNLENLLKSEINIKYGCYYLSYLFNKYGDLDHVLAAYNGGEGNVDKWLEQNEFEIQFSETQNFINRVKNSQIRYKMLYFGE